MRVRFTTDGSVTSSGFIATYWAQAGGFVQCTDCPAGTTSIAGQLLAALPVEQAHTPVMAWQVVNGILLNSPAVQGAHPVVLAS